MTDIVELISEREDGKGRIGAKSLFKQYDKDGTEDIQEWRKRFVATLDPTEYAGGIALLGSWENWQKFKRNWPSFKSMHLNSWLEEIEIAIKSKSITNLVKAAIGTEIDGIARMDVGAAKFLVEGKHQDKLVGRPTKERIEKQLRIETAVQREAANDLDRIKEFK